MANFGLSRIALTQHSILVTSLLPLPPTSRKSWLTGTTERNLHYLGPTMIHMQTKAESYKFFGRRFVSLDDELSNTVAIGSDRDVALRKGF